MTTVEERSLLYENLKTLGLIPTHAGPNYVEPELYHGYIIRRKIGKGAFSKVYKVKDPTTDKVYAMKKYNCDCKEGINCSIVRELFLLKSLSHKNILKCYKISIKEPSFCILELMDTNLLDYIKSIHTGSEEYYHPISIFLQIVRGLDFLHRNKIIHADLKPSNILMKNTITEPIVKIADIDCVISPDNNEATMGVCTLWYRAPELLPGFIYPVSCGFSKPKNYTNSIDIWSLGCIFYELYEGKALFPSDSEENLGNKISMYFRDKEDYESTIPRKYKKLFDSMLDLNPEKRPTTKDILSFFQTESQTGICNFSVNFYTVDDVLHKEYTELYSTIESLLDFIFKIYRIYPYIITAIKNILYKYWLLSPPCLNTPNFINQAIGCSVISFKIFGYDMTLEKIINDINSHSETVNSLVNPCLKNNYISNKDFIALEYDILEKILG